jgi:hypothetical protein
MICLQGVPLPWLPTGEHGISNGARSRKSEFYQMSLHIVRHLLPCMGPFPDSEGHIAWQSCFKTCLTGQSRYQTVGSQATCLCHNHYHKEWPRKGIGSGCLQGPPHLACISTKGQPSWLRSWLAGRWSLGYPKPKRYSSPATQGHLRTQQATAVSKHFAN